MSDAKVSAVQNVGSVSGGAVYGVYIEHYITASSKAAPPVEDQRAFLERVVQAQQRKEDKYRDRTTERYLGSIREEVARVVDQFYREPFHIRLIGVSQPQHLPFYEGVNKLHQDVAGQGKCIVVMAESGSGKTLAIHHLWRDLAREALVALDSGALAQIPILVSLSELTADLSLEALIQATFSTYAAKSFTIEQIDQMLHEQQCVLLLDGLDEMPDVCILKVGRFLREHPSTFTVATTRSSTYHNQLEETQIVVLDDLEEEQAKRILGSRWADLNEPMQRLARNRTLLWQMIEVIGDIAARKEQEHERGLSLQTALSKGRLVQVLMVQRLQHTINGQAPGPLGHELLQGLLEQLGYAFQYAGTYRYSDRQIMQVVSAYLDSWHDQHPWQEIVRFLNSPLGILERRPEQWRFCDRMSQAYFAAAAALHDPAKKAHILQCAADPWWHETLEILIGLLDDPIEVVLALIDADPVTAADRLGKAGRPLTQYLADALLDGLKEHLAYGRATERERAVSCIARIQHKESWAILTKSAIDTSYSSVILAIVRAYQQFELKDGSSEDTTNLQAPLSKDRLEVATRILDRCRLYPACAEDQRQLIEEELIQLVRQPRVNSQLKGLAAIGLGLTGSARARDVLRAEFENWPKHTELECWCITDALTQMPDESIDRLALQLAGDRRPRNTCRARAVYLLGWAVDKEAAARMLVNVLRDEGEDEEVRRRAAQAIGHLKPPHATEDLRQQLVIEGDERVVDKIVQALGELGDPEVLPLLEHRVHRVVRAATRRHIREAIALIRYRASTD